MYAGLEALKITDHVYWVGAIDWELRDFHGYATGRGSTYNAFLVCGERIALIDTVKKPFKGEMLARIRSVIDPGEIDYIVVNHAEMDHTGSLPEVIAEVAPEKVLASSPCVKALQDHFHLTGGVQAVKDGERLSLGNLTLTFLETRMLHWPDSMFTYCEDEKVLFSQDAFGSHLATSRRYADEIDPDVVKFESAKYYANILLPYSGLVEKLLARVAALGLRPAFVLPDHGPFWRRDIDTLLGWYAAWAEQRPERRAIVVYDTMWGSTAAMAKVIGEGLARTGVETTVMPLHGSHRSDVATALLGAGALLVGSPTINNGMFPTVADLLTYLKGLKPRNLAGAAFGSYGWSGEAVGEINEYLAGMKVERAGEGLKVKYVPRPEALGECVALGELVGRTLNERCGA
ncbi:MAG TPA: MBL fold metallo-hydrolase [Planctomycetes bacterium]|nr:MBL fold metallo-hydrolase [Planctomycetota bacterium]